MRRRIRDFAAVVVMLELLLDLNFIVCAQLPENSQMQESAFGTSLIDKNKKTKKKYQGVGSPRVTNDVLRVDTALVVNEVLVRDKKGNPINGLNRNDFTINEDSVPQKIDVFDMGGNSGIPRSIVLIMDYSLSELPYIETSAEAAKVLIDKLSPGDRVAIVTDDTELLVNFTSDKQVLKEKLDWLEKKALSGKVGQSRQYSALAAALNELFPEGTLRPIVIFQTDGDQLSDFTSDGYGMTETGKGSKNFKRLLSELEQTGATVYTIVPGPRFNVRSRSELMQTAEKGLLDAARAYSDHVKPQNDTDKIVLNREFISLWGNARRRDESALEYLSRFTGGVTEHILTPQDADSVYSRVLSVMNQRYVIGYYPTNQQRDGKRRKIRLGIRDHSEYVILGRKTYIAPEGNSVSTINDKP